MEMLDVRGMSVNEYCNYVEGRAIHLGVSAWELNIDCCEMGLIDWEMYESAKAELFKRQLDMEYEYN
jgi:hypothetical protein